MPTTAKNSLALSRRIHTTLIVGPMFSGKSLIADAIRTQNAKQGIDTLVLDGERGMVAERRLNAYLTDWVKRRPPYTRVDPKTIQRRIVVCMQTQPRAGLIPWDRVIVLAGIGPSRF